MIGSLWFPKLNIFPSTQHFELFFEYNMSIIKKKNEKKCEKIAQHPKHFWSITLMSRDLFECWEKKIEKFFFIIIWFWQFSIRNQVITLIIKIFLLQKHFKQDIQKRNKSCFIDYIEYYSQHNTYTPTKKQITFQENIWNFDLLLIFRNQLFNNPLCFSWSTKMVNHSIKSNLQSIITATLD